VAVPFLVRLAAPDRDAQPLGRLLVVLDVQGDQFGAAEGAGEADQQKRALMKPDNPGRCLDAAGRCVASEAG
jgi:hypothetical protein